MKAFRLIDVEERGSINADALTNFLNKNYCSARFADGDDIVKEFDSDCDGTLNFDEFCMLVLPSASSSLRD